MRCLTVALLLLSCTALSLPLAAQTTSGSITGTVLDAQGAAVPGATVKAANVDQNTVLTTTTNVSGIFVFPQLLPARYSITVEKTGFRKFEQRDVVLQANSALALPTIGLEMGQLSQTVEVMAQGEQLQAANAEQGNTIVGQQLSDVEVKGRTYLGLIRLAPGTWTDRDYSTNTNELGNIYANGSRGNQQHLTVNGVTNTDYGANGRMIVTVSLESVQEFRILTGNYQAQYGFGAGAEVMVVTKSGTSNFHGGGYWYFRDKGMNANNWRNNRDGVAKPYYHYNYGGYLIGGPVYIPGKFNTNKDKLFFFWSDEYQRQLTPVDQNGNSVFRINVPTALERQGDFSQSVDKNGRLYNLIRDPLSGQPCTSTNAAGCFAGGGVLGRIPASRLYDPGMKLLNLFPLPNSNAVGFNYTYQIAGSTPRHEQVLRLDYNPTDKWRLYSTWINLAQDVVDINACASGYSLCPNFPITPISFYHPGFMVNLSATRIITPTMTNEASFHVNYHPVTIFPDNPSAVSRSATGINLPTLYQPYAGYIPDFTFSGTRIGSSPQLRYSGAGGAWSPFISYQTIFEWVDNFSLVRGKHFLKSGIYYHRNRKDQTAFVSSEGVYDFGDNASNPYDTTFGFANAAVGVYNSITQANRYANGRYRFTNLEFYAQDTFKVTPRVTLDYGVRFYWIQPEYDAGQLTSNFLPNLFDPKQASRLYQPGFDASGTRVAFDPVTGQTLPSVAIGALIPNSGNLLNGIRQAGHGIDKYLMKSAGILPAPRFGIAIDMTGKQNLIFRAGGGVMYDRYQGNEIFNLLPNPPTIYQSTVYYGFASQLNSSQALTSPPGLTAIDYNGRIPTVYKYSAGLQSRLPWGIVLDTSYVGTLGRHLIYNYPLNALPYGTTFLPQNQDPTKVKANPSATLGSNAYDTNFLRPYQGFGSINVESFGATSNYNSLQISANRRFTKGLFLGAAYTWSKCMATGSDDGTTFRIDGKSLQGLYGPCSYDIGQNLTVNYVYSLPGVNGLGSFNNALTRTIFNDWQVAGTTLFYSGTPFSVGVSIPGYGNAQVTGSDQGFRVKLIGNPRTGVSDSPYYRLNPAAFAPPPVGTVGLDAPVNYMRNPGVNNWDMSLQKAFRLAERLRMEFRADAFNAFNHTQFSGINSTINFAGINNPTVTNLPVNSSGQVTNVNGFGTVSGARAPRIMQMMVRIVF